MSSSPNYYHNENSENSDSPFTRWRRLRNDPRFIEAVTTFCEEEAQARYYIALEYASWWPSNVRNFRFELLIILERDIAVEMLVEREGRRQIEIAEDGELFLIEQLFEHKQLFAFWPRWVEYAHGVLAARIWTEESLVRNEFTHRMHIINLGQLKEREKLVRDVIMKKIYEIPLEWGDFVPPEIQKKKEDDAKRIADIRAQQERDVQNLKALYANQVQHILRQKWEDLLTSLDAGRKRIEWMEKQQFSAVLDKCFPSSMFANGEDDGDDDDYFVSPLKMSQEKFSV